MSEPMSGGFSIDEQTARVLRGDLLVHGFDIDVVRLMSLDGASYAKLRESTYRVIDLKRRMVESRIEAEEIFRKWVSTCITIYHLKLQLWGMLLPRSVRSAVLDPFFQDLLSQFIEDIGTIGPMNMASAEARDRRFEREMAWAIVSTWRALIADRLARSARWVAAAVLGDGAVRAIYWTCSEILRKL